MTFSMTTPVVLSVTIVMSVFVLTVTSEQTIPVTNTTPGVCNFSEYKITDTIYNVNISEIPSGYVAVSLVNDFCWETTDMMQFSNVSTAWGFKMWLFRKGSPDTVPAIWSTKSKSWWNFTRFTTSQVYYNLTGVTADKPYIELALRMDIPISKQGVFRLVVLDKLENLPYGGLSDASGTTTPTVTSTTTSSITSTTAVLQTTTPPPIAIPSLVDIVGPYVPPQSGGGGSATIGGAVNPISFPGGDMVKPPAWVVLPIDAGPLPDGF